MKKIFKLMFAVCAFILFCGATKANSISSIKMDIYVDNNGDAYIKEVWDANLNQGTEGYRFYGNMGNSIITDYKVSKDGRDFESLSYWNVNADFNEKAYKSGIYDAGDHKELCFGISKYGKNIYTLSYTIKGFVSTTTDSDIIYWELIPTDLANLADKVYIKIHSDFKYADTLDVWGYGNYGGYAYVYDGYIEMSNDNLKSNEYMTILVKFDKGTFNTTNEIGNDFNHYYEMAEDGAEHYVDDSKDPAGTFFGILTVLINVIVWGLIIFGITKASANSGLKSGDKTLDYGEKGRKLPNDVNLFRELPCGKDIFRAYWVAYNYKLMKKQTDFLGAILLKWVKEGIVTIESKTVGKLFKKEDTTIVFKEGVTFDTQLESDLYQYMYEASKDGILESKEFEKWCSSHYSKILAWFDKVLSYENNILIEEGKLVPIEKTSLKIFKSTVYQVNPLMYDEAVKMKGLKQFFNEFDNMKDKEAIEVNLWEEYLMYAQIFGVAEKVAKQFKEMYPDVITDQTYNSMVFVHTISRSGMASASSAKSRAESYSSGGGGFSSGGGGGGSFGGGGGGGFR